ncbi:putative endo-1,3(4)-beta-glucanase 2 [Aspergillus udagawae]|nr:putative endo-1,3(4)-beta-glucanase 2 [Aspergillus udagawae]
MVVATMWRSTVMLTWLLASETVHSLPWPVEPTSTIEFRTQYPPKTQEARLLVPETHGFYPTSLEREGRLAKQPFPTNLKLDHLLDPLLHPQAGSKSGVLDLLLSGLLPQTHHVPTKRPTTNPPVVTSSSPSEASTSDQTLPLITSPPVVPTASTSLTTANEEASDAIVSQNTGSTRPGYSSQDNNSSSSSETASETTSAGETQATISTTSGGSVQESQSSSETTSAGETQVTISTTSGGSVQQSQSSSETVSASATPMAGGQDVFVPVSSGPIPNTIDSRNDHPVPKNGIVDTDTPVETNKFYCGLFLGTQTNDTFTHPYSIAWVKGSGTTQSYGMAISHVESNVVAQGPVNTAIPGSPISYYINAIGIRSIILSASELGASTVLTTENPLPFSANAVLRPSAGSSQSITFPVVQGMGFVTGIYSNLQPMIQSGVFFNKMVTAGSPRAGIFKYILSLEDGTSWLLYATPDDGADPELRLVSNSEISGPAGWSGTIQVAKNPAGASGEKFYDNSSGVYAVEGAVMGSVSESTGTYNLMWAKAGKYAQNTPLLMFALPHHMESFDASTQSRATSITLRTTTKGQATAVIGEYWTMVEPELPISMGFAPWSVSGGSIDRISPAAQQVILAAAPTELQQDMDAQTDLDSMYFSGKALSKFATLVYTVDKLGGNSTLAAEGLARLKNSFARFIDNKQQFPLVYDNVWKGVVSSASYASGDVGADFGNTLYNDHHFHYGYFIHAAAIIGSMDPQWLLTSKDWVNMLVRDAGNSAGDDPLFPFSRGFDWFHGHSWAKGLFESFDGKDEESTSEDAMFAYALKMWGKTIGDASMEARGNLMLGILRRSLRNYFLMESDNKNQPANFVANKVTGILFENKVDHTTYFGNNLEYIQGIHMLPLLPSSAFVRSKEFVKEEWDAMFASNGPAPAENVVGGWKGVLYANLALVDPAASWNFFTQPNFDYSWIDGGASRTWYLAYAAGLGAVPS